MKRWFRTFVVITLLMESLSLPDISSACSCSLPSVCRAYSQAAAVFIGRLEDIRDTDPDKSTTPFRPKTGRFSVERVFKGAVSNEMLITFEPDSCIDRQFTIGRKYFIYTDTSNTVQQCNRTLLYDEKSPDYLYASNLVAKRPILMIRGRIIGLDATDLRTVKVLITGIKKRFELNVDGEGIFSLTVRERGAYNVELNLPRAGAVEATSGDIGYDVQTMNSETRTVVRYEVEFRPNSCDDRQLSVLKANK